MTSARVPNTCISLYNIDYARFLQCRMDGQVSHLDFFIMFFTGNAFRNKTEISSVDNNNFLRIT